jgi:formate dehydrogenase
LFDAILTGSHGIVITEDDYDVTWSRLRDNKVRLHLADLLEVVATLPETDGDPGDWPFVLSAGERRAFTANTIVRDPSWRKRDSGGALRMSATDADRLGLSAGDLVRVTTRRGSTEVPVEPTDRMRPGHLSLPNGFGLSVADPDGTTITTGVAPNELTQFDSRDEWVGTPWHKYVPARLETVGA